MEGLVVVWGGGSMLCVFHIKRLWIKIGGREQALERKSVLGVHTVYMEEDVGVKNNVTACGELLELRVCIIGKESLFSIVGDPAPP